MTNIQGEDITKKEAGARREVQKEGQCSGGLALAPVKDFRSSEQDRLPPGSSSQVIRQHCRVS
jgi:hypothetical protein